VSRTRHSISKTAGLIGDDGRAIEDPVHPSPPCTAPNTPSATAPKGGSAAPPPTTSRRAGSSTTARAPRSGSRNLSPDKHTGKGKEKRKEFHAYLVLSNMTGIRTEEVRPLEWKRTHLNPVKGERCTCDQQHSETLPPHIEV